MSSDGSVRCSTCRSSSCYQRTASRRIARRSTACFPERRRRDCCGRFLQLRRLACASVSQCPPSRPLRPAASSAGWRGGAGNYAWLAGAKPRVAWLDRVVDDLEPLVEWGEGALHRVLSATPCRRAQVRKSRRGG